MRMWSVTDEQCEVYAPMPRDQSMTLVEDEANRATVEQTGLELT